MTLVLVLMGVAVIGYCAVTAWRQALSRGTRDAVWGWFWLALVLLWTVATVVHFIRTGEWLVPQVDPYFGPGGT